MVAMLNVIVLLDGSHEGYCHGITNSINLQGDDKIVVGWGRHHVHMDKRRVVCASLDLVFGFGALVIFTYIPSVLITTWRSRHNQPRGFSKFQEQDEDVEQGLSIPHLGTTGPAQVVAAEPRRPATPQSPPPSYHSAVLELDEEYPDLNSHAPGTTAPARRSSMETVSSLGVERYLVSDGWRAPENPPEYSSRPPSLHYAVP
ncbi:uncharacterized protein CTHT_0042660 [Thermochaetoides thermophila DSM 1495]|uniref:Uncharacterized protein n=1 Tax=Chaetomium thermophilum (strain DSM 1495 / CBS 144.50 / IMI 039719) TaxID=759272 RepID=G0SAL0_CHATD|nr:hypothetical protein CTHT_0042660 [Thermochaetoides thermophila DSM 1495]EGS19782.1 hypothetical protein CTHT_0042660 [Thermochaetoides thermophila DSM 1495]